MLIDHNQTVSLWHRHGKTGICKHFILILEWVIVGLPITVWEPTLDVRI